jgi:ABC-type transport system involved in cytochrome c biogenesis permease subunit
MKKADIVTSLFLMVTGLVMIFVIIPAQTYPGEEYGVPPATVPTAAMSVVTFMACILLAQCLIGRRKNEKDTPSPIKRSEWLHIAGFTAMLFAGLAAIKFLHFIPGGILILAVMMIITGQRKPLTIILVSVPIPFLVYAALWYGLRIPLP